MKYNKFMNIFMPFVLVGSGVSICTTELLKHFNKPITWGAGIVVLFIGMLWMYKSKEIINEIKWINKR